MSGKPGRTRLPNPLMRVAQVADAVEGPSDAMRWGRIGSVQ